MLWALLGRMMRGRCITDTQRLDCYSDVGQHLREQCEGRRHCDVQVYTLAPLLTSCGNLQFYLHADHDCVDGA